MRSYSTLDTMSMVRPPSRLRVPALGRHGHQPAGYACSMSDSRSQTGRSGSQRRRKNDGDVAEVTGALDKIIRFALEAFHREVLSAGWFGREREAISLFAFRHLLAHVRPGSVLFDPAQIAIEVAVPQIPGPKRKAQVCKDLVIWREPASTCWFQPGRADDLPLSVLEWKHRRSVPAAEDVGWLRAFSAGKRGFIGFAIAFNLRARRLSACRVELGQTYPAWLEL